jgi:GTPase SAR1 family protein
MHKSESARSHEIDKQLKKEKEKLRPENHVKVLLLGPANSGKTTVLKQILLFHGKTFDHAERVNFKVTIFQNIVNTNLQYR